MTETVSYKTFEDTQRCVSIVMNYATVAVYHHIRCIKVCDSYAC